MNYTQLTRIKSAYKNKRAIQLAIIIHNTNSESKRRRCKQELFEMSKEFIVSNIENFFSMLNKANFNATEEDFLTRDDMVSEAYIVLETSINNFMKIGEMLYGKKVIPPNAPMDVKKWRKYNWAMYYNKSLSRSFFRLVEKHYGKRKDFDNCEDFSLLERKMPSKTIEVDLLEFELKKLGYDVEEMRVIESRMAEEKLETFLEANPDITRNNYFKILTSIKTKMNGHIAHNVAFNRGV